MLKWYGDIQRGCASFGVPTSAVILSSSICRYIFHPQTSFMCPFPFQFKKLSKTYFNIGLSESRLLGQKALCKAIGDELDSNLSLALA